MATVTRAEFELLRDELRDTRAALRSLEQKLWGIVAALALIAVGALFQHGGPHLDSGQASLAGATVLDFGRALLAYWR